jgi:hypothetical protein
MPLQYFFYLRIIFLLLSSGGANKTNWVECGEERDACILKTG